MDHKIDVERKFANGKCIFESVYPLYDSYFVIESSDEESDEESDTPEPNASSSKTSSNLPQDKSHPYYFSEAMYELIMENKSDILDEQYKSCVDFMEKKNKEAENGLIVNEKLCEEVLNNIKELHNLIYDDYKPTLCSVGEVDLDDIENDTDKNKNNDWVAIGDNSIILKRKNSVDDDEKVKKKKEDNVEFIGIDIPSESELPSDLPNEGIIRYPNIVAGDLVYGVKHLLHPWFQGRVLSPVNDDYYHIKFFYDEKLATRKEIALFSMSPVRFPVGCRVIAKYNIPGKSVENFYSGVVAEPPKLLNNFR